jgi:hypothetical protein
MSDDAPVVIVEDPPNPDLPELQQRDLAIPPVVPVVIQGPVLTRAQPARSGPAFPQALTDRVEQVLAADPRRSRATMVSGDDWLYMQSSNGQRLPWPADVPLVILHGDAVWATRAAAAEQDGILSVVTEIYAD